MTETATEWSLRTWKERHERGYFPNSEQHRDWKVYAEPPAWLLPLVTPDDRCLEIGCGYGEWMIPLHLATGAIVSGIDVHEEPVAKANEFFAERGLTKCKAMVGDGTRIPFDKDWITVVYSISVFQHLPREIVAGYLKESKRVVCHGGTVAHHFRNADNVGPYPTPAKDIEANHTGDFSCGWTAGEVREAFAAAGMPGCEVLDLGLFLVGVWRDGK